MEIKPMKLFSILLSLLTISTSYASELVIEWRVETPFAPFGWLSDPDDATMRWTPKSDETFSEWSKRVVLDTGGSSPFKSFATGETQSPWLSDSSQYDRRYVFPKAVNIKAKLAGASGSCSWLLQGQKKSIKTDCSNEIKIGNVPIAGTSLKVIAEEHGVTTSTFISVDHRIILALGDSYASGEGNPDYPTQWKNKNVNLGDMKWIDRNRQGNAQWWDNACHRSFFSNQTFVALKISSLNPHRLVTYLHYSCSGAEILDGMLVKQKWPPGVHQLCNQSNNIGEGQFFSEARECYVPKSQLASAVSDLCQGKTYQIGTRGAHFDKYARSIIERKNHKLYRAHVYRENGLDLLKCNGNLRVPDLILLSIGGNDVGFTSLIGWAIAPSRWRSRIVGSLVKGKVVCPDRAKSQGCKKPYDIDLINQLDRRNEMLGKAMREVLHSDQTTVVQSTYPTPLLNVDGTYCGDKAGHNPDNPWASAMFLTGRITKKWEFNIRPDESRILSQYTIPKLQSAILLGIRKNGFVKADLNKLFVGHGWCSPKQGDPPLSLPSNINNMDAPKWSCGTPIVSNNPSCWDGYSNMNRFVRTMNDSFLTQSSNRGDGQSGTMHPNLWGHASMAEELYRTVQQEVPWITDR